MIPAYCKTLGYKDAGSAKADLSSVQHISLTKSTPSLFGPGEKISGGPEGIFAGAVSLLNSNVFGPYQRLCKVIDPGYPKGGLRKYTLVELLNMVSDSSPTKVRFQQIIGTYRSLGKLGFKLEAAGKVRVFAMVECWTQ